MHAAWLTIVHASNSVICRDVIEAFTLARHRDAAPGRAPGGRGDGLLRRAARQLGYTQSAVSVQVATLAAAACACSIAAVGAGVVPTDAGERILRHAVRLTAQLQAAEADLTALAEGTAATLRVGTFQSVSIRVLPDACAA